MIAIIDLGMSNIKSVANALEFIGADICLTSAHKEIRDADRLVFPGQGTFGDCMKAIKSLDLFDLLNEEVLVNRKPFLGICLGMQILADCSHENGLHNGFGWIPGTVERLKDKDKTLRLPHVGWNTVNFQGKAHPLFRGVSNGTDFYFVHSYHFNCNDKEYIATESEYGENFTSAVYKDNIFATQFHPERSQSNGLKILTNFLRWSG